MKVAIISGAFPGMHGGIADYTGILAEHLAEQKAEVSVITTKAPAIRKAKGVKVYPAIEKWDFSCFKRINRLIEEIKPDVIQLEFPGVPSPFDRHPAFNLLPCYLKMKNKENIVFTSHEYGLYTVLGKLRQFLAFMPSDKLITVTHDDYNKLHSVFGEKVRQVRIGANIFPAKRNEREIKAIRQKVAPEGERLACFFGRFAEQKGLEDLLQGLANEKERDNIKLLAIGEFESKAFERKIMSLVNKLGLSKKVAWAGYLTDEKLSQHFYASDFAVLPFEDGLTFRRGSFLAALVHGLPVVSTKSRITPPELKNEKNILLVPAHNPKALGWAIAAMAKDKGLRERIKGEAFKLRPLFDWKEIAREHLKIYNQIR